MSERPNSSPRAKLRAVTCAAGWHLPRLFRYSPRAVTVLMYHGTPLGDLPGGVDGQAFERQIQFLRRHVDFVVPEQLAVRSGFIGRPRVLLTFDDGFRNNADIAVPTLRRYGIPAVFFVANRHAVPGRYLWFAYLRGLAHSFPGTGFEFRGQWLDMQPERRAATVARLRALLTTLRPHPFAMDQAIDEELPPLESFMAPDEIRNAWAGMDAAQVAEIAADPLFRVGAHTVDHPYLTLCDPDVAARQLAANKAWIEEVTGQPCELVAYPLGDYDARTVAIVRALGFRQGYAVAPRSLGAPELEIARIGIYRPSLEELGAKVIWGPALRRLGRAIG